MFGGNLNLFPDIYDRMTGFPWHLQTYPAGPNTFNPRNREDTCSRKTWTKNVTDRDRLAERQRRFDQIRKKYPDLPVPAVVKLMRSF
jgi:hypothetical protein